MSHDAGLAGQVTKCAGVHSIQDPCVVVEGEETNPFVLPVLDVLEPLRGRRVHQCNLLSSGASSTDNPSLRLENFRGELVSRTSELDGEVGPSAVDDIDPRCVNDLSQMREPSRSFDLATDQHVFIATLRSSCNRGGLFAGANGGDSDCSGSRVKPSADIVRIRGRPRPCCHSSRAAGFRQATDDVVIPAVFEAVEF